MVALKLATSGGVPPGVFGGPEPTPAPTPTPTPGQTVTAMLMGQSEMNWLLNPDGLYHAIPDPVPGNGNLIVFYQGGPNTAPVRTVVNAATVAAGQVNAAMAALSALLDHAAPGVQFVIGDGAVGGTSRGDLFDDTTDETSEASPSPRIWTDFTSVVDAIESEFGTVNHLIECWYNADAALIDDFKANFWPFYFGANADGTPFTLGDDVTSAEYGSRQVDHCLWDASADPSAKGRGIFSRNATKWHVLSPMPFFNSPVDPEEELESFSQGNLRLSEPNRQVILNLADDPIAQSVGIRVGPSAHISDFGGGIHPRTDVPDGQILLVWPIAVAMLRAAGIAMAEPTVVGIEGASDGTYADIIVDLPNGGDLTTLAGVRDDTYQGAAPHQQAITGIEVSRAGGARRPVYQLEQDDYPSSHRGTVTIQDPGSGSPRQGRIRVAMEEPFVFGDQLSLLRGQATGVLLEPRDLDLYAWLPIEHVPALYDEGATYPMEGIAVRPYQDNLAIPVDAPAFEPRGAYFDGTSSYDGAVGVPASGSGLLSFWMRCDADSWNDPKRNLLQLMFGSSAGLDIYLGTANRITLRLFNDAGSINSFYAAPGNAPFVYGSYYHIAVTWAAGGAVVYVNGVQVTGFAFTNVTMAGQTITGIGLGADAVGRYNWLGDLGHFYLNLSETIDLSEPANMARLIDAGAPANMGSAGELVTGNAPEFYFDGDAPAWSNRGTAGGIPLNGALMASDLAPVLPG